MLCSVALGNNYSPITDMLLLLNYHYDVLNVIY